MLPDCSTKVVRPVWVPVGYGSCSDERTNALAVQDSVKVVQKFMETAGEDVSFNLIALAPPSPYD